MAACGWLCCDSWDWLCCDFHGWHLSNFKRLGSCSAVFAVTGRCERPWTPTSGPAPSQRAGGTRESTSSSVSTGSTVRRQLIAMTVRRQLIAMTVRRQLIAMTVRRQLIAMTVRRQLIAMTVRRQLIAMTVRRQLIAMTRRQLTINRVVGWLQVTLLTCDLCGWITVLTYDLCGDYRWHCSPVTGNSADLLQVTVQTCAWCVPMWWLQVTVLTCYR